MKLRQILIAFSVAGGLLVTGGFLAAQPADDADKKPEVTVPMEKRAKLTPQEMRVEADGRIKGMQEMLSRVVALQRVARREKDVIKLNCVNDKLLQVKQLLNIAERSNTGMVEAIAQQDDASRYHEFGQIIIAQEKVSGLRDEAEACIGEELIFLGPTKVDVDEPDIPDDPTRDDPSYDGDLFEPPRYASPYA